TASSDVCLRLPTVHESGSSRRGGFTRAAVSPGRPPARGGAFSTLCPAAAVVFSIGLASAVVNLVLKPLGDRRRPNRYTYAVPVARQVAMPRSTSFPSGHSASAFAFATGVGAAWPGAGVPLSVVASLVTYSRVHTGVHFPSDTIAGTASGVALAPIAVAAVRGARQRWSRTSRPLGQRPRP